MSRDELNASELAELAALDRILAREPVGEEHLELAALVDSVRAGAPQMDRDVAARLDAAPAQVAQAWLLSVSPNLLLIPGTGSLEHLEENVAAGALRLSDEDFADLAA